MSSDSENQVNQGRRTLLLAGTAATGAIGAGFAAVPFVKAWFPNAKAKNAGAPVVEDISKLEEGQLKVTEWRGKPVWIIKRPSDAMSDLPNLNDKLQDPGSDKSDQPEYTKNEFRSREDTSNIVVLVGLCTHLGCSPLHKPTKNDPAMLEGWVGGFYCPCHGSFFDLAGRVYKNVPAPKNLEVPPYYFVDENTILIGEDGASTGEA